MKLVFTFFIALLSSGVFATQNFSGPGEGIYPRSGNVYPCSEIFLNFDLDEEKFELHRGGYICGLLQAEYDPFILDIRNNRLLAEGVDIGSIDEHQLNIGIDDLSDNSRFELKLDFLDNEIIYRETWYQNQSLMLTITGKLRRLNP